MQSRLRTHAQSDLHLRYSNKPDCEKSCAKRYIGDMESINIVALQKTADPGSVKKWLIASKGCASTHGLPGACVSVNTNNMFLIYIYVVDVLIRMHVHMQVDIFRHTKLSSNVELFLVYTYKSM